MFGVEFCCRWTNVEPERIGATGTGGHGIDREIGYLTVHSMLHLLGYDHVNGGVEKMRMREKEEQVLSLLGRAIVKE